MNKRSILLVLAGWLLSLVLPPTLLLNLFRSFTTRAS